MKFTLQKISAKKGLKAGGERQFEDSGGWYCNEVNGNAVKRRYITAGGD